MKLLSCVRLFVTPWTAAYKAPLSMEFSRQEYWSGLSFSSPGDLSDPRLEPRSPALQADALPSEPPGKPPVFIQFSPRSTHRCLERETCLTLSVQFSSVAQLCPTLCDPMDCSLSRSSVHGIFQSRVLEWIAISFSRGSSRPRNRTWVSRIAGRRFTV